MSQKFGFVCNDGGAPGREPWGGRREGDGQAGNVPIRVN